MTAVYAMVTKPPKKVRNQQSRSKYICVPTIHICVQSTNTLLLFWSRFFLDVWQLAHFPTFPTFSYIFNTDICSSYSLNFLNRLVTLVWMYLWWIIPRHCTPPSQYHMADFDVWRHNGVKPDRQGDWNGKKRRVGVSYLQRSCRPCV